ncbi:MAG: pseudouridine synthase [Eubacteriales bacterium]|nr:pseudouridine synthase [Eubacteriales bacterium]
MNEEMRLQKYMALCGVASRRACEEIILNGRVSVNGKIVDKLGVKVTDGDEIMVDSKIIRISSKKIYIMVNKPAGIVTTMNDEQGRENVSSLYANEIRERIYPVGRLDMYSEGLLLMTNDGDLAYSLTHPKHVIDKTYLVTIKGHISELELKKLRSGVVIDGKKTSEAQVKEVGGDSTSTILEFVIHEGRNRQIRKMLEALDKKVVRLQRVKIGNLTLGHIPEGRWRHLTPSEIKYLNSIG